MKEKKNAAKETFNGTAFAQLFACLQVGGKQERLRCAFGVPGNDCHCAQDGMNPGDELQPPVGGI